MADQLEIERLGGLAGFGSPNSHVRSRGQVEIAALPAADRQALESLFSNPQNIPSQPDEFRYRLTRRTEKGPQSVEVPERQVPLTVRSAVRDELQ